MSRLCPFMASGKLWRMYACVFVRSAVRVSMYARMAEDSSGCACQVSREPLVEYSGSYVSHELCYPESVCTSVPHIDGWLPCPVASFPGWDCWTPCSSYVAVGASGDMPPHCEVQPSCPNVLASTQSSSVMGIPVALICIFLMTSGIDLAAPRRWCSGCTSNMISPFFRSRWLVTGPGG